MPLLMPDIDTIEDDRFRPAARRAEDRPPSTNPAIDRPADVYSLGKILAEILGADRPLELDALCVAMQHVSAPQRPTARACADRIEQYLDGDRDLARRRALADELVGFARAAHGAQPARAMRCGPRARRSRSIPRVEGAAELVTTLMLEPPAGRAAALERRARRGRPRGYQPPREGRDPRLSADCRVHPAGPSSRTCCRGRDRRRRRSPRS